MTSDVVLEWCGERVNFSFSRGEILNNLSEVVKLELGVLPVGLANTLQI